MVSVAVVLVVCALVAVLYTFVRKPAPSSLVLPPMVSGAWPYVGHMTAFLSPKKFFAQAHAKYGGFYRIKLFGREWFILSDRDQFDQYYKTTEDVISFHEPLKHLMMNDMLFGYGGEDGVAMSYFNVNAIKKAVGMKMDDAITEVSIKIIDEMPERGTMDLFYFSARVVGRILGKTFFGFHLSDSTLAEMQRFSMACDSAILVSTISTTIARYFMVPRIHKLRNALVVKLLPYVKILRETPDSERPVYIRALFDSKVQGRSPTDEDVAKAFFGTYFGALTNTSRALANMMMFTAEYTEKSARLKDELRELSVSEVSSNKLFQSWIEETARISKGYCGSYRACVTDGVTLSGFDVPNGAHFLLDSLSADMQSDSVQERETFDPERWLQAAKLPKNLNWGAGIHLCPGRNFAYAEIKFSMNQLLRRVHFEKPASSFKWTADMAGGFVKFPYSYTVNYHKI